VIIYGFVPFVRIFYNQISLGTCGHHQLSPGQLSPPVNAFLTSWSAASSHLFAFIDAQATIRHCFHVVLRLPALVTCFPVPVHLSRHTLLSRPNNQQPVAAFSFDLSQLLLLSQLIALRAYLGRRITRGSRKREGFALYLYTFASCFPLSPHAPLSSVNVRAIGRAILYLMIISAACDLGSTLPV
jgi:hypothetical protein